MAGQSIDIQLDREDIILVLIEANERQKSLECRENSVEPPIILKLVDEERIVRLVWDWTPSDLLPTW